MATTTKHTVTIPVQVDRDKLLNSVMGTMWETWSWWQSYEYADGCGWDKYPDNPRAPYITVSVDDPNYDEGEQSLTVTLSVNDIIESVANTLKYHPWVRWDDMDASSGDIVMQYAVLGDYVYA